MLDVTGSGGGVLGPAKGVTGIAGLAAAGAAVGSGEGFDEATTLVLFRALEAGSPKAATAALELLTSAVLLLVVTVPFT